MEQERGVEASGPKAAPITPVAAKPRTIRAGRSSAGSELLAMVQPKLEVGASNDRYEREADSMADTIVRRLSSGSSITGDGESTTDGGEEGGRVRRSGITASPEIHRCTAACQHPSRIQRFAGESASSETHHDTAAFEHPGRIQRFAGRSAAADTIGLDGGTADSDTERIVQSSAGGRPLATPVRRQMEGAFGADFSGVRVHTGEQASELNNRIQAKAFTYGSDIYFRDGMPDTSSKDGQSLVAHELTHTLQQSGSAHRTIQRKAVQPFNPPGGLNPVTDWIAYSGGTDKPKRSSKLKLLDQAVTTYASHGSRGLPNGYGAALPLIDKILQAENVWRTSKKGKASYRDLAVQGLLAALVTERKPYEDTKLAREENEAGSQEKLKAFQTFGDDIDPYARRTGTPAMFFKDEVDRQQMANIVAQKGADGRLTEGALDALDEYNLLEQEKYKEKARAHTIDIDDSVTDEQLMQLMDESKNPLSDRTDLPELANVLAPGDGPTGEFTETIVVGGTTLTVTYDRSDVNAPERIEALRTAVTRINQVTSGVPNLEVYFPKLGRSLSISGDCKVTVGGKNDDAIYIPPGFFAVSSQNVGNPKVDEVEGEKKFLSTRLGPANAMVHTIVHELGHAMHYKHSREGFYNLSFAQFKGKNEAGEMRQRAVQHEVSAYASNNPREMVAEVFLGHIIGGTHYSAEVWDMYDLFGGEPLAH